VQRYISLSMTVTQRIGWLLSPESIRRGIPATYFVSTHYIESGEPFPHDVAAGTLFASQSSRRDSVDGRDWYYHRSSLAYPCGLRQRPFPMTYCDVKSPTLRKKLSGLDWTIDPLLCISLWSTFQRIAACDR
jgi:hypothetical protein